MHVAVLGAGALGSVYGVRLSRRAAVDVTFVVRPARVNERAPVVVERVRRAAREQLDSPSRSASVPASADVVLLAVGASDLEAIRAPLAGSDAPIVVLTPMLPRAFAAMREAFGDRVFAAMPNVVAYARDDGVVRYWLPAAATRIDEPRGGAHAESIAALVRALDLAGMRPRLELAVHETNPATTIAFFPIALGVSIAGSIERLAGDRALTALARRACREALGLARTIGRPAPLAPLAQLVATRVSLGAAVAVLRRASPEALFYVEEHFARKLRAQHRMMAREVRELASSRGLPHEALDELERRLV